MVSQVLTFRPGLRLGQPSVLHQLEGEGDVVDLKQIEDRVVREGIYLIGVTKVRFHTSAKVLHSNTSAKVLHLKKNVILFTSTHFIFRF